MTPRAASAATTAGLAAGALALAAGLLTGHAPAVFAALDASWLFVAGLSAGAVAFAAAIRLVQGGWATPVLPIAEAATRFFPIAFALLVLLLLGMRTLAPESTLPGVALRLLISSALVFGLGWRLVASARSGARERTRAAALAYLVAYAIGLSLWAFDLVLALTAAPPYAVVPAYYFMGSFLSGLAWTALVAARRGIAGPDLRHDLGKLLFGFIVVWSYLLWSLFLPTWYGNVPEESAALVARWSGAYRPIAVCVLVAVFAWPFWLLFDEQLKRRRLTLGLGAATILAGMWAERFLLVLPSLGLRAAPFDLLVGGGVSVGVACLFLRTAAGAARAASPAPA